MNGKNLQPAILAALPGSSPEIAQKTGISGSTVRKHIQELREQEPKRIYIMGWSRKTVGKFVAVYAIGDKPDKACPFQKLTMKQKNKRAWRQTKLTRSNEHKKAMERARNAANRAAKAEVPNTWLSPLYAINGIAVGDRARPVVIRMVPMGVSA
jgi:predicted ArsR family transcriptional regulator